MKITSLPEDLKIKDTTAVQLFDYRVNDSLWRTKINLTKNTFSFLQEGTKEIITNNKSTTINNEEFLIIKSGKCLMTETISRVHQTYHSVLLFFTDEMLLEFLEKNKTKLRASGNPTSFLVSSYDDYIKHFVQSLERINKMNKSLRETLLKLKFEEVMTYLLQKEGEEFLNAILEKHDDQTVRFKQVIENNKLNKLSLQDLSFLCNMSLSTFKRTFKKHYEVTPIKWFQDQRLEHAAFLLSTQKKRPIELFEAAGYETLSNFVQAFKKKYKITPKQFQLDQLDF